MNKYVKKILNIPKRIDREIQTAKYRKGDFSNILQVRNIESTLEYLENNEVSFYRYGDGEVAIMMGEGIAFQKADKELARRLTELLSAKEDGIKAAIPYGYFTYEKGMIPTFEGFVYAMKIQRKFFFEHCRKDYEYLDTAITQAYQCYEDRNFDNYFTRFKNLFEGRKVTVICGKGVLDSIEYSLLEKCSEVNYLYGPSKNAFSEYDELLSKAKQIPKDNLVCIVLGPTAKVLVYDLFKEGYQAWDMGHSLKDYDAYCKKASRDNDSIVKFFKPD